MTNWNLMLAYYCGAAATFVMYFVAMLWAGRVFDQYDTIDKRKLAMHSVVLVSLFVGEIAPRSRTRDEGRPLGAGLQEQASNYLKLLW